MNVMYLCMFGNVPLYKTIFMTVLFVFCLCLSSLSSPSRSTITLVGAKKRKRNASSDHSDGELSPASPAALEDDLIMVQAHVT